MPGHSNLKKIDWGRAFTIGGIAYKYAYRTHRGRKYRQKFKRLGKRGKWVAVGVAFVFVAATWTPATGFSWLFRMIHR